MKEIKIVNKDCLEIIDRLPLGAFFISDPPYNQKYHYDLYGDNLGKQEYRDLLYQVFSDRKSIIIHYPEDTINILATLDIGKCEEVVSWVYNSNTAKQHRLITWWNCKPSFIKIPQEYKNKDDKRIKERIGNGKMARGYDWWEINQVKNVSKKDNHHSCPMPLEVMERIIKSTTNEGDLIVDPFMGSGTTGVACARLNRKFIGIEISKTYFEIAKARIKAELAQGRLL